MVLRDEKHPFEREPNSMRTGHFTQVVWKAMKEYGISKAIAPGSGKVIFLGHYDLLGNFIGQYAKNVLQPK